MKTLYSNLITVQLFICLLSSSTQHLAQNQHSKWYFGNKAGLDFMGGSPTVLVNSNLLSLAGCASMANAAGNLLFYTNAASIYNQNHVFMAGGFSIGGDLQAVQPVIIVPKPGSSFIYYVFTNNTAPIDFAYSIVDMSLASGLGSVTVNHSVLLPSATFTNFTGSSNVTATKHCNGNDYWVLTHGLVDKTFYAYLLTSAGLNTIAVTSLVGQDTVSGGGYLKFSPNGKKVAILAKNNTCVVHDFDIATGAVSSSSVLLSVDASTGAYINGNSYGLEFSPDGTKLYASGLSGNALYPCNLYQWDLCAGNALAVSASRTIIRSDTGTQMSNIPGGALQLASNGKIYRARYVIDTLGVINNPNATGAACNYVHSGQPVAPKTSYQGLPNFINSPGAPAPFTYTLACRTVSFTAPVVCLAVNYPVLSSTWVFGDPASGASNTVTGLSTTSHSYQSAGTYTAQLILNYACRTDTLRQTFSIPTATTTNFSVTSATTICKNHTVTLNATASSSLGPLTYSWSTLNASTSAVAVSPSVTTVYSVTGKDANGCAATKTIQVTVSPCLGIQELNTELLTSLYPNPNNGTFSIDTKLEKVEFKIYDGLGMLVYTGVVVNDKRVVDISHLAKGLYFVELSSGKQIAVLKLIKTE